jgi:hypothetical protein
MDKEKVLQLTKLVPAGEAALRASYEVLSYDEATDPLGWLNAHGPEIRAVVTSGHEGLSNELADRLPALGIIAISGLDTTVSISTVRVGRAIASLTRRTS